MNFQNLTREDIVKLGETSSELTGALILYLWDENQMLKLRIKELEDRLKLNSSNSSKPPSSDGYKKPNPKSLRGKSGKPSGGQHGHKAHQLPLNENPDQVIIHALDICEKCHFDLKNTPPVDWKIRQVLDFIAKIETTEHRAQMKICPKCHYQNQASFPTGIDYKTQYGESTKAIFSYLNIQQLLPLKRLTETIQDLTGHSVSQGAIVHANEELYKKLAHPEEQIKQQLLASRVVHFDESGVRVNGKLNWLHTACTPELTFYFVHPKRGKVAMDEGSILSDYTGTAMHDGLASYRTYKCGHALGNQHHHRELIAVVENDRQTWGQLMIDLLYDIKKKKEERISAGFAQMEPEQIAGYEAKYRIVLDIGLAENPPPQPSVEKKKGRIKQSKAKNLLDRLENRQAVLAFMYDFQVPFTNNLAEQAIRMIKTMQKISGSFRSKKGADIFCRIRGFVSTLRKQDLPILKKIRDVFASKPVIPAPPLIN
jgi:transposase